MAGIVQEKILYLKVTCGRMIHKKEGVITHDFGGYEGTFLGIREKEGEFEGQKTLGIELKMKDTQSEEIAIIQFTKMALFSKGFFSCISKVDLDKPFSILVWGSDKNEKISFCGLKQEGYVYEGKRKTIEPDKSFPSYIEIPLNGKMERDWSAPLAAMDEIIKNINESRAVKIADDTAVDAPAEAAINEKDDLPF